MRNVCHKKVISFNRLWEENSQEEEAREEKVGATEDQALTIQRRRSELLKHLLSSLAFMNEEDDEAEGSRRSLPTKQIKISIQLS